MQHISTRYHIPRIYSISINTNREDMVVGIIYPHYNYNIKDTSIFSIF